MTRLFRSADDEDIGANVCTIEQALVGWLVNKLLTIAVEVYETVVDAVQQLIGAIVKLVKGEVAVTVQLELRNSDPKFDTAELVRSGWNDGAPLTLKGLKVRVYQGVAEFTGTTDAGGVATVEVAKHLEAKACVDLENNRAVIIDTFTDRRICFNQRIAGTGVPVTVTLATNDKYANLLATITDAADYMFMVMNHTVSRVTVLTGWQSAILTSLNNGRSFAPCMGRLPNLAANLLIYAGSAAHPVITIIGEILEFLAAYDIVMGDGDVAVQIAGGKPGRRFATTLVHQVTLPTSSGHPDATFSSSGGAITITRSSVGRYLVELAGLQKEPGHTENVQVSALSTLPRTCNAVDIRNSATGLQVSVECRQGAAMVDARFQLTVLE
jgi:hypothetical protein